MNIANWTILDQRGPVWSVSCHCGYKTTFAAVLMTRPPKCKRCGATAPVQKPVDKPATPPMADAFFKVFGMVPVEAEPVVRPVPEPKPVKVAKVKEPKPPKQPKGHALNRDLAPIELGPYKDTRLTILEQAPNGRWGDRQVRCLCKCGTYCTVAYFRILKGITRSCGCFGREVAQSNHKRRPVLRGLPGDKHGPLTVLREAGKVGKACYRSVVAVCTCGKERTITVKRLTSLTEDRCRCYQVERPLPKGFGQPRKPPLQEESARYVRRYKRLQSRIAKYEALLAELHDALEALTPPATVAN